jgi:hypothetical protein
MSQWIVTMNVCGSDRRAHLEIPLLCLLRNSLPNKGAEKHDLSAGGGALYPKTNVILEIFRQIIKEVK